MEAASEPASGSVSAKAASVRPAARSGNQRACWSGEPAMSSGSEPSSWTMRLRLLLAQEVSSAAAMLHGERQGKDILCSEQLPDVLGELTGPVDLGGPRRDPCDGKGAGGIAGEH